MKTCRLCGQEKDVSLFSERNPNLCAACMFGLNIDQEQEDEARGFAELSGDHSEPLGTDWQDIAQSRTPFAQ